MLVQKGREVIGLPVVALGTADELGLVEDLLWSHTDLEISALVVNDQFLPFSEIRSVGTDAVTISGEKALQQDYAFSEGAGFPERTALAGAANKVLSVAKVGGMPILSGDGHNLGTLSDVIFDKNSGKLSGYELSTGVVDDFISGRKIISPRVILSWGEEAIIADLVGEKQR